MTDEILPIESSDQSHAKQRRGLRRSRPSLEWLKGLKEIPLTMTRQDLATILHVTPGTLRTWDRSGIGPPAIHIGYNQIIYMRDDLLAFIDVQRDQRYEDTVKKYRFHKVPNRTAPMSDVVARPKDKPATIPAHLAFRKKSP